MFETYQRLSSVPCLLLSPLLSFGASFRLKSASGAIKIINLTGLFSLFSFFVFPLFLLP